MYPILFKIGPLTIYSYNVFLALAFLSGLYLVMKQAKKEGIERKKILILSICLLIATQIGGRIFSILFEGTLGSIYYGAIITGIIVTALYCYKERLSFWRIVDIYAPVIALGQAIGKIGCFLNGCCYGKILFIPTQLFESFTLLAIFLILVTYRKYKEKEGNIFLLYLVFYSISRFIVELFRQDYRGELILNLFTISQFISILLLVTASVMLNRKLNKNLSERIEIRVNNTVKGIEFYLIVILMILAPFNLGCGSQEKKPLPGIITKIIEIINPARDSKFTFDTLSIGVCEINCEAGIILTDFNTEENRNKIEWEIPRIEGSILFVDPVTKKGTRIKISYNGLPIDNMQFGDKTLRVKLETNSKKYDYSRIIKIFYPRDATNNPGKKDPNWYYYWSEALGVAGQHIYDNTLSTSETTVYSATSWKIKIAPNASWPAGNPPTGQKYIEGFWATNLHEFWHRDHRVHNFSVHGGWNPSTGFDYDADGICDHESGETSPSVDGINKGWESKIGTMWNKFNSTEEGGNWAELNGTYTHKSLDWAYPGSQWE